MKHTQEKWIKANTNQTFRFEIIGNGDCHITNKAIAFIPKGSFVNDEEAEANANLVAAAPEMANLLEWIIKEIETTPDCLSDALLGLIKIKSKSIIDNLNQ
jgi:hypothetical protein